MFGLAPFDYANYSQLCDINYSYSQIDDLSYYCPNQTGNQEFKDFTQNIEDDMNYTNSNYYNNTFLSQMDNSNTKNAKLLDEIDGSHNQAKFIDESQSQHNLTEMISVNKSSRLLDEIEDKSIHYTNSIGGRLLDEIEDRSIQ